MIRLLRKYLHRSPRYLDFRQAQREGLRTAAARFLRQRRILKTRPVRTAGSGSAEVRILTCRTDAVNAIWSLKSFFRCAGTDFPLHIHDGGLLPFHLRVLREHFPGAFIHPEAETTARVGALLERRGLAHCNRCRQSNNHLYKLFDFYLLSEAKRVIAFDSDVLFFAPPVELLDAAAGPGGNNLYCRDYQYAYTVSLERMSELAGAPVTPRINSGILCVDPGTFDFEFIEQCLANESAFRESRAFVEQSLHAIANAASGRTAVFLPESYRVSARPGLEVPTFAKHYVAFPRPLLYTEGMPALERRGLLSGRPPTRTGD